MTRLPDKYKQFICVCVNTSSSYIGVGHYSIDIYYMAEDKNKDGYDTQGEMVVDDRYLKATLKLYPCVFEMWERNELKEVMNIVFHEVAHIATQRLRDVAVATYKTESEMKDAWETLTERIARMAIRIHDLKGGSDESRSNGV